MRWWRRNDGFEWKEYVRTTVLVRRRQRRDKIEAAKVAAVEGVKEAGRKGIAAGAAGAEAAGQAAVKIAKSAAEGAAGGAGRGLALFVRSLAAARTRMAETSAPLNARLSAPRVSLALGAVAALTGVGFAARAWQFGVDLDAAILCAVALAAGVAWLWPRLFASTQDAEDQWTSRTERVVAVVDQAGSLLPVGAAAVFAAVALWLAVPVASRWFGTAGSPSPSGPSTAEAVVALELASVRGAARVTGPGLLRVDGRTIRLDGITMLDFGQICRRADGVTWDCGAAAKQAFEKLVRGRRGINCHIDGEADGVSGGRCEDNGKDLAAEIVRQGFAFSDGVLWSAYSSQQSEAKDAKVGLWAGEPERPESWRDRLFADAAATAPHGCPVKGRIQSGRRTYVLPHHAEYARVSIREDRGERWFCSVEDAEAAGFQPREAKP